MRSLDSVVATAVEMRSSVLFLMCSCLFDFILIHVHKYISIQINGGFPGGSDSKESNTNTRDLGFISGSEKFPGEGNDYLLQYSCLENSMNRRAWLARVHGVAKSQTPLRN